MAKSGTKRKLNECGTQEDEQFSGENEKNRTRIDRAVEINQKKVVKNKDEEEGDDENDDNLFYVETILDMKIENQKRLYLVKWAGYDDSANTWEPEENMTGSDEAVQEFLSKTKKNKNLIIRKKKTSFSASDPSNQRQQKAKPILGSFGQVRRNSENDLCPQKPTTAATTTTSVTGQLANKSKKAKQSIPPSNTVIIKAVNPLDPVGIHVFRLWIQNSVHLLHLDTGDTRDVHYNVIITKDTDHLNLEYVYGSAKAIDGNEYCLVKFKEHNFVDVMEPSDLVKHLSNENGIV